MFLPLSCTASAAWMMLPGSDSHMERCNHVESGEELFEVFLDPQTDQVMYRIRAPSWPQTTLARVGQPIVRALQARFRRHSAAALKRATCADGTRR